MLVPGLESGTPDVSREGRRGSSPWPDIVRVQMARLVEADFIHAVLKSRGDDVTLGKGRERGHEDDGVVELNHVDWWRKCNGYENLVLLGLTL